MSKKQVILAGTGGQGIILMGIILAKAALLDGNYVIQSQNYGPESRGGASRTDIIISNEEIYYPKVLNADVFLALSQEAFNKYCKYIKDKTIIITDTTVNTLNYCNCNKFDIIKYTYNSISKPMTINMVSLGIINSITNLVSTDSIKKAMESNVPKGTIDINYFAYLQGYSLLKNQ